MSPDRPSRIRTIARLACAFFFASVGISHFTHPALFEAIVPPYLPAPALLVALSGLFEILGGLALLLPRTRNLGRWGLLALLLAVFPANLHMALHPGDFASLGVTPTMLYLRLPIQIVLAAWVWWAGRP